MNSFQDIKRELFLDPAIRQEYNIHQAEFDVARTLIKARLEAQMTQAGVALKMCTSQS